MSSLTIPPFVCASVHPKTCFLWNLGERFSSSNPIAAPANGSSIHFYPLSPESHQTQESIMNTSDINAPIPTTLPNFLLNSRIISSFRNLNTKGSKCYGWATSVTSIRTKQQNPRISEKTCPINGLTPAKEKADTGSSLLAKPATGSFICF